MRREVSAGAGADAGSPRAAHCTTSGIIIFSPSSGERAMRCEMTISTARQQSCTTTYVTSMCCTYPISSRLYLFLRAAPRDEHSAGGRRRRAAAAQESGGGSHPHHDKQRQQLRDRRHLRRGGRGVSHDYCCLRRAAAGPVPHETCLDGALCDGSAPTCRGSSTDREPGWAEPAPRVDELTRQAK